MKARPEKSCELIAGAWMHFDKQDLPRYVRRRAAIGRRLLPVEAVEIGDVSAGLTVLGLSLVRDAFGWLNGGRSSPSAWLACVLQNGGGFYVPDGNNAWHFHRLDRHFDFNLPSEAAGLCATLLAANRLDRECADALLPVPHSLRQLMRQLARFSEVHPQAEALSRILD
jgi:hypothetical protein